MRRNLLRSVAVFASLWLPAVSLADPPADRTPGAGGAAAGGQSVSGERPANLPQLGGWDRTVRGPARDQAGQQWREGHGGWDRDAPWRQDRQWWRNDSAFRLYAGPRAGFLFIPDIGYVSAPDRYQHGDWRAGEYLPKWFWRFMVRNHWRYGLPRPPEGCVWVWAGDNVALIDPADGYILDIVDQVW